LHDTLANIAAGPFAAACLVLAFAGLAKIRRPSAARAAAAAAGLPAWPLAVRGLGVLELAAATAGITFGGAAAGAVAGLYLGLTVVAARLLARSPGTNCGCLGASDAPVSVGHVIVDSVAVVTALAASLGDSPLTAPGTSGAVRVAFLAGVGCCAWLVGQVLETLPALGRAVRAEHAP
jgi:hypothetical protein